MNPSKLMKLKREFPFLTSVFKLFDLEEGNLDHIKVLKTTIELFYCMPLLSRINGNEIDTTNWRLYLIILEDSIYPVLPSELYVGYTKKRFSEGESIIQNIVSNNIDPKRICAIVKIRYSRIGYSKPNDNTKWSMLIFKPPKETDIYSSISRLMDATRLSLSS